MSKYLHLDEPPQASMGRFWRLSCGLDRRSIHLDSALSPNSEDFARSRTLFSMTFIVVDQVTKEIWQKQGRVGPRRTPALWLMFWAYLWHAGLCGWPVGTRDSAVVVRQRSCYLCETRHGGDLAAHQPLFHSGLAWKTRTTLNLQMRIQSCDSGARKDRRNKVAW